jgi:uncharacterized protein (TIRG00374 family)
VPSNPIAAEAGASQFTRRRKVALAVTALVYLAAAVIAYQLIDKATVKTALAMPAGLVAALFGLSFFNYVVRAWRWVVLARFLGFGVGTGRNILYYFAGYSLTTTPGKAGEAVRLWFLKSGHGVAYARSVPLMLADRIVDTWAMGILALVSITGFAAYRWEGVAVALLLVLLSVPILFPRLFEPALGWLDSRMPRHARLLERARHMLEVMARLASWRTYGVTLVPSVAGWLAEGLAFYLVLRHFGAEVTVLNAVFVFAFSAIVGAISMLPGGLGSTEATMVLLLKALGMGLDSALAATAIIRVATLWFAVGLGVLLMPAAMNAAAASARRASGQGAA